MAASKVRSELEVGRGGFAYLALSLAVLLTAAYMQNNPLYWAFGLMMGGAVVSALAARLALRAVRVQRLLPEHGVVGAPLVVRYRVTNAKRLLPVFNLVIEEVWSPAPALGVTGGMAAPAPGGRVRSSLRRLYRRWRGRRSRLATPRNLARRPHAWMMHLGPRQTVEAEAPCWPLRRGPLAFERIVLSTSFPLGVFRRVVAFSRPGSVLVYPRLYQVRRELWHRLAVADPAGHLRRNTSGGGGEEFLGLRPYRPGDRLRAIDWRRSARSGELISREMTLPAPPRLMLLLDLQSSTRVPPLEVQSASPGPGHATGGPAHPGPSDTADPVERTICLAASLLCAGHLQGYEIGLIVAGAAAPWSRAQRGLLHRTRLLETLALLDADKAQAAPPGPPVDATVVLRPGPAGGRGSTGPCLVLSAADLDLYLAPPPGGALALLARTRGVLRRRSAVQGGAAWL